MAPTKKDMNNTVLQRSRSIRVVVNDDYRCRQRLLARRGERGFIPHTEFDAKGIGRTLRKRTFIWVRTDGSHRWMLIPNWLLDVANDFPKGFPKR